MWCNGRYDSRTSFQFIADSVTQNFELIECFHLPASGVCLQCAVYDDVSYSIHRKRP